MKEIALIYIFLFSSFSFGEGINSNSLFRIKGNNVRLREKPDISSKIIKNLEKGTFLEIVYPPKFTNQTLKINEINVNGNWVYVKISNNLYGYVFSEYIGFDIKSKVLPGFIIKTINSNLFELIGLSQNNLIEYSTSYSDEAKLRIDKIPNSKINLVEFNGKRVNELNSIYINKNDDSCDYMITCFSGNLTSKQKTKYTLGFSDSNILIFNPVIINYKINIELKNKIVKYSNEQLKTINLKEDGNNWIHYEFMTTIGKKKYIISEYNSSIPRLNQSDIHIFRVDLIEGENINNLVFYNVKGTQRETFKTIAITDINGDNFPEIWLEVEGYEWWYYSTFVIIDKLILPVYQGGGGGV
ncbi:SH3 domain-containing protein [Leptospira mtsangambouensis]|uniref:SH3 domain-containing protein n=1 Tax=Leptospira mtsangambouensis TaxID=2484912 RepID=UPI001EEAE1C0|nr:SH3 domain-containing protein [Leptospira mtsangambouensis]MCG6142688.1 SH3 domain-containing protein [Leptospira mtsangambouensis]